MLVQLQNIQLKLVYQHHYVNHQQACLFVLLQLLTFKHFDPHSSFWGTSSQYLSDIDKNESKMKANTPDAKNPPKLKLNDKP